MFNKDLIPMGLLWLAAWLTGWLTIPLSGPHAAEFQPPRDVTFVSKVDGTEQRYVLMLPKDLPGERKVDLVIALHGHGSDRWQFVNAERDECRAAREMAAKHNMIYLCPDPTKVNGAVSMNGTANMLEYAGFAAAIEQAYGASYSSPRRGP